MTSDQRSKGVKWWIYLVVLALLAAAVVGVVILQPKEDSAAAIQPTATPTIPPVQTVSPTPSPTVRPAYIPDPDELQEIPAFETLPITGDIGVVRNEAGGGLSLDWEIDPLADYYVLCVVDADHEVLRQDILWPDIEAWEIPDFRGAGVLLLSYTDMGEDSAQDDVLEDAHFTDVTSMMYGLEPDATAVPAPEMEGLSQYYILVDKADHAFSIFTYDESGEYTIKVATFPCALGRSSRMTPTGTFSISSKGEWKRWGSGQYSPYYTRYTSGLYIHGPIYRSKNNGRLRPGSYEEIGSDASSGCVRTTVAGARFVYFNCPAGTVIEIVAETDLVSWPGLPEIDPNYPTWDPTDPLKPEPPEATVTPGATPAPEVTE